MDYSGFQASCHKIWHYEEMSHSKPWFIHAKTNENNYFQNAKKKKKKKAVCQTCLNNVFVNMGSSILS
jgi:GT2 family glycosyltransferase